MLYFVTEILFGIYAVLYSIALWGRQTNSKTYYESCSWFMFLLCGYFSILSLWVILQNNLYLVMPYLYIDRLTIILKMAILFLGLLSSFLGIGSTWLIQLSYLLVTGSCLLSCSSLVLVITFLLVMWVLEFLVNYVKFDSNVVIFLGEELGLITLILGLLLVTFFNTNFVVFWGNYLIFFGLYALLGFGLLHALFSSNSRSVCINWFIILNLRNLVLLGILLKFVLVSQWALQLSTMMGVLNLVIGTSMLMMQTAIYPIVLGTMISSIGFALILVGICANKLLIVLFYLIWTVPVMAFIATINHLSRDKKLVNVHDLAGVMHVNLGIGLSLLVNIFSIIGMPLTIGFLSKFLMLSILLINANLLLLLVVVFNQVVTTVSYFKILKVVMLDEYVFNYNRSKLGKHSVGLLIINTLVILYNFYFSYVEVMSN